MRDRAGMPRPDTGSWFHRSQLAGMGIQPDSAVTRDSCRERRIELAGEGFRWDDLARWKAGAICNNVKTYIGKREPYKEGQYAIVYPAYTNDNYSYEAGKSRTWNDRLYLMSDTDRGTSEK